MAREYPYTIRLQPTDFSTPHTRIHKPS
ncbi:hypothetical protein AZE42_03693 [Rhizopogon vesiculosus]|uniref:Uncharacterized protein n=1 Tax=Rhizopogon vesiculosus TaxID=180088 RepID=A0A1J8Q3V1_9AGAM|nr:hypothetical protein AZE42_03693 [Rhizopogon vesiculosus]